MTRIIPKFESDKTGADFTGSDGATNRTYTLAYSGAISAGFSILKQGAPLHQFSDFTLDTSTSVITITVEVFDADVLYFDYNIEVSDGTVTTTAYATTSQLNKYMHLDAALPDRRLDTATRPLEVVGTGDDSITKFYTDKAAVMAGTYTLYYGSTEVLALAQPLTETTHYALDKDDGIITLTATGVTLISTDNIYASYEYNLLKITDSFLQDALDRAASFIDDETSNHWADGSEDSPNYTQVTNEKHTGKGRFDRDYFLRNLPLPDVSTTLSSSVAVSDTSLSVSSTAGFLDTGIVSIGSEKFTYSAKTGTTFTVAAATDTHSSGDSVYPWAFEFSVSDSGSAVTWTVMTVDTEYDLNMSSGRVHIYRDDIELTVVNSSAPFRGVPNRFRSSYVWGNSVIPKDLEKVNLMLAANDLLHGAVRRATADGKNDFRPDLVDVDLKWIDRTLDKYRNMQVTNV